MSELITGEGDESQSLSVVLFDENSKHVYDRFGYWSFTGTRKPSEIHYVPHSLYSRIKPDNSLIDIAVYTDNFIHRKFTQSIKSKYHVAWILESRAISPKIYKKIKRHYQHFDLVVTHNMELVEIDSRFEYAPFGGTWLSDDEIREVESANYIECKDRLISIIASQKNYAPGHKLRHKVIATYGNQGNLDVFGFGYRPLSSKFQALKRYKFSVSILNDSYANYFTEILLDLLLTKTIPVFWGKPSYVSEFNQDGILFWENLKELEDIMSELSEELYLSKRSAVEENFQIAKLLMNSDHNFRKAIRSRLNV